MKTILNLCLFLCLSHQGISQHLKIDWQKTIGFEKNDVVNAVMEDKQGNIVLVGQSHGKNFEANLWGLKIDGAGQILWNTVFEETGFQSAAAIIPFGDNYLLAVNDKKQKQRAQVLLVEIDDAGVIKNKTTVHTDGYLIVNDFIKTKTGFCLMGTRIINQNDAQTKNVVLKLDDELETVWEKEFIPERIFSEIPTGEIFEDAGTTEGNAIIQIDDTDLVFTGYITSDLVTDFWTIRLNENKEIVWESRINEHLGGDEAYQVFYTDDEHLLVVGTRYDKKKGIAYRGNIFKLDKATGEVIFSKLYVAEETKHFDRITNACKTEQGYLLIGTSGENPWFAEDGKFVLDTWIVHVDNNGELLWQETIIEPEEQEGMHVLATKDGAYYVFIKTRNKTNGLDDIQILKIDF